MSGKQSPHCFLRMTATACSMSTPARDTRFALTAGIDVATTYAAFLQAIALRSFDNICTYATDRLRAELLKMRACSDFPVLFGLWCESYPSVATFLSVHYRDNETAIANVAGDVAGERVHARILLRRFDGKWYVDREC